MTRPVVEFSEGWAYVRAAQGLLIFSPGECGEALRRGRLQRVADIIKSKGWIAHRELLSSTRYGGKDLDELCQTLTGMGRIKPEPGKRGGRGWRWISTQAAGK